jgi:hypothetical protein
VADLRVMTWNVENLFLPNMGEGAPDTQPAFDAKVDSLARVINEIVNGPSGSEVDLTPGSGFQRPDHDDGYRMFNLAPLIPEADRYSRIYKGRRERIDHIFASHRLVNPANLPTVTTARDVGELPSVSDEPGVRRNEPVSDHAAVRATFAI